MKTTANNNKEIISHIESFKTNKAREHIDDCSIEERTEHDAQTRVEADCVDDVGGFEGSVGEDDEKGNAQVGDYRVEVVFDR